MVRALRRLRRWGFRVVRRVTGGPAEVLTLVHAGPSAAVSRLLASRPEITSFVKNSIPQSV